MSSTTTGLNIPHSSVFINNVYDQQKIIIENAFAINKLNNDNGIITVNLHTQLNYRLIDDIIDKGYNLHSQNNSDGTYTIYIKPATYLPELHSSRDPHTIQLLRMIRYFQ
jgi:hypothetical protein